MNNNEKWDVVIPVLDKDFINIKRNLKLIAELLPTKRVVLIGNDALEMLINKSRIQAQFVNENSIISFDSVKKIMAHYSNNNELALKRTGWYYQQFLKMLYAYYCDDEYYITWDADTIPTKPVDMFDNGHPLFDMKDEYNKPYFDTISRLIPDLRKIVDNSFISEHMIIKASLMKQLICELTQIDFSKNDADKLARTIIENIDTDCLPKSGFSEFETYGTYAMTRNPELYRYREWRSYRKAGFYFSAKHMTKGDLHWLSNQYEAITLEKYYKQIRGRSFLFHNPILHKMYTLEETIELSEKIGRLTYSLKFWKH